MNLNRTPQLFSLAFISTWIFLAAVSLRSGYEIKDVKSLNWDIALMLSPWGFIHNFWLVPDHYLRPYYDYPADRGSLLHDPLLAIFIAFTLISAVAGLIAFRKMSAPRA